MLLADDAELRYLAACSSDAEQELAGHEEQQAESERELADAEDDDETGGAWRDGATTC